MNTNVVQQTLDALKVAQQRPVDSGLPALAKAFTQSGSPISGLTAYDLQGPAKQLFPVLTPLRNRIPRVGGGVGTQANWRAITGINIANAGIGVSQGSRGVVTTTSTKDYTAAYKAIGLEDYVTFEADLAATGFDDVKALAALNLLRAVMIGEEKMILGGNTSMPLGTTPAPSLAASASGGALASGTLSVIAVALSLDGYLASSVNGGLPLSGNRTLADGSSESYAQGTAQKSASATVSVTGPDGSVAASVSPIAGAVAYAWFWGAAGAEALGAITTINSVLITDVAAGSQGAAGNFGSDQSANALAFDGLLTQVLKSGSNGYVATLATGTAGTGTPLTSDGVGGIVEIDAALKSFWDEFRLSPSDIYVSSQEQLNISKKILAASSGAAQRITLDAKDGIPGGGFVVRSYMNKYALDGAQEIPIRLHPNVPAGTILFYTDILPYPLSNTTNLLQVRSRRDYYQLEWPIRTRRYEYGVYSDQVLQCFFPPAFGVIQNIGNG